MYPHVNILSKLLLKICLDEQVNIMVKPYNSYCLDKLWIGTDIKNNPNDQDGKMLLQKYLFDHGLDKPAFENLLKGLCPSRPFIPLEGQTYKGRIKGFKGQTLAEKIVVEANIGEVLFFEASREDVFVYGHWMGKADLRYIFDEDDEVCFEIHPVYAKNEHQNFDGPQASVVWLGSVNERPKYAGLETTPVINAQIDEKLWEFVKSKKMDEKMFRALVIIYFNHFFDEKKYLLSEEDRILGVIFCVCTYLMIF